MPLMEASVGPKTVANAEQQFVEVYGSALVLNTYLKIALVLTLIVAGGLVAGWVRAQSQLANVKPLVIRIDSLGRAEGQYDATVAYKPEVAELQYFIKQFIVMHYSRVRATINRDFPQSLLFLNDSLRSSTTNQLTEGQMIGNFLEGMATQEVSVDIRNIVLTEIRTTPYRAQVDFTQQAYVPNSYVKLASTLWTAQVEMTRLPKPPTDWILTNPLGFQITYLRVDPATFDRIK